MAFCCKKKEDKSIPKISRRDPAPAKKEPAKANTEASKGQAKQQSDKPQPQSATQGKPEAKAQKTNEEQPEVEKQIKKKAATGTQAKEKTQPVVKDKAVKLETKGKIEPAAPAQSKPPDPEPGPVRYEDMNLEDRIPSYIRRDLENQKMEDKKEEVQKPDGRTLADEAKKTDDPKSKTLHIQMHGKEVADDTYMDFGVSDRLPESLKQSEDKKPESTKKTVKRSGRNDPNYKTMKGIKGSEIFAKDETQKKEPEDPDHQTTEKDCSEATESGSDARHNSSSHRSGSH